MISFPKIEYLCDEILSNYNIDWLDIEMNDIIIDEMPKTMYDVDQYTNFSP